VPGAVGGEIAQVRGVGFARGVRLAGFGEVAGAVDGLGQFVARAVSVGLAVSVC
jgi:hypothetical protein